MAHHVPCALWFSVRRSLFSLPSCFLRDVVAYVDSQRRTSFVGVWREEPGRRARRSRRLLVNPGLELTVKHSSLTRGWLGMVRIRTGTFAYAPRLAASGNIEARYRTVCPFCESDSAENAEHLLLWCRRWDRARQWLLREARINPPLDVRTVGVLLGGGRDAAKRPLQATMVATAIYLDAVIRRRAGMLREMTH